MQQLPGVQGEVQRGPTDMCPVREKPVGPVPLRLRLGAFLDTETFKQGFKSSTNRQPAPSAWRSHFTVGDGCVPTERSEPRTRRDLEISLGAPGRRNDGSGVRVGRATSRA